MKPSKRQSSEKGVFNLEDGDLLWKLWYSNEVDGFQCSMISIRRREGRLEMATITRGPSGKRWWLLPVKSDTDVVKEATDLIQELGDDLLSFSHIDLSAIDSFDAQIKRIRAEGLEVYDLDDYYRRTNLNKRGSLGTDRK